MTILTSADFQVKPYVMPNQADLSESYDLFIDEQVEQLLADLLGSPFYNALKAGVEALPADWLYDSTYALDALVVSGNKIYKSLQADNQGKAVTEVLWWVEEPANKWLILRYGATYIYPETSGKEYTWVGLKKMLKPAVYCNYLRDYSSDETGVGTAVSNTENGEVASPDAKMSKMWNTYDRIASGGNSVWDLNIDTFYGYLFANKEEFDEDVTAKGYDDFEQYLDLNFNGPGNMNVWNL